MACKIRDKRATKRVIKPPDLIICDGVLIGARKENMSLNLLLFCIASNSRGYQISKKLLALSSIKIISNCRSIAMTIKFSRLLPIFRALFNEGRFTTVLIRCKTFGFSFFFFYLLTRCSNNLINGVVLVPSLLRNNNNNDYLLPGSNCNSFIH